jgi:hypothetical protein
MTKAFLDEIRLSEGGGGGDPKTGLCVMELVSWLEGAEDTTDRPRLSSPALTSFAIALNDSAPSARTRDTLKPMAALLCCSLDPDHESARIDYIRRAVAREIAPALLRHVGLESAAQNLRRAKSEAELQAGARAARAEAGRDARTLVVARLLDSLCARDAEGVAEQVLLHLEDTAGPGRLRLMLWRKMRAILDGAIKLGRAGSLDDPKFAARLGALELLLHPDRARPAAPFPALQPALPAWLDALVHGPAAAPDIAPAPPAALKRDLIDA